MDNVISGVAKFQSEVYPERKEQFEKLANGQSPEVLMIACADSRVDPGLVTQTDPGDLFVCRNAGNVVPPHSGQSEGMTASIEFAVAALGVSHIVVCGHTDCGAMKGALNPEALDHVPNVKSWLGNCRAAAEVVKEKHGCELTMDHLHEMTEENIVLQLQHLRTHPVVAAKLATNQVELHGWLYDIETGEVQCYNEAQGTFEPMGERYAEQFASRTAVSI